MRTCTICQESYEKTKPLDLYTIGSEGTNVCLDCELLIVEYIRGLRVIAAKSRKLGYKNAKLVQASKAKQKGQNHAR